MPALCGAILVPIAYQIVIELGLGHKTAFLASILLICGTFQEESYFQKLNTTN